MASGEALKGRLDVLEHNPKEGFVVVGSGGGGAETGALEGWTDVAGRMKVVKSPAKVEYKYCTLTPVSTVDVSRTECFLFLFFFKERAGEGGGVIVWSRCSCPPINRLLRAASFACMLYFRWMSSSVSKMTDCCCCAVVLLRCCVFALFRYCAVVLLCVAHGLTALLCAPCLVSLCQSFRCWSWAGRG